MGLRVFDNPDALRRNGFVGFESVEALRAVGYASVPEVPGVYLVVRPAGSAPRLLEANNAGRRRGGTDPTEPIALLQAAWVEMACVLYVGMAGRLGTSATLRSRIKSYLRQGLGHNAGHAGGRRIWQLADSAALLFAWRPERDPYEVEQLLIQSFERAHGRRPFANRR